MTYVVERRRVSVRDGKLAAGLCCAAEAAKVLKVKVVMRAFVRDLRRTIVRVEDVGKDAVGAGVGRVPPELEVAGAVNRA